MNILQHCSRGVIKHSFYLSVRLLRYIYRTKDLTCQTSRLACLPEGTLGHAISRCLTKHELALVPNFESHDLKHVLLGYDMTPEDEIRLQAYMIGNGNYSLPSFLIFFFGAILLPELLPTFYKDYSRGRHSLAIKDWTLDAYAYCSLEHLRNQIKLSEQIAKRPVMGIRQLMPWLSIFAGVFGMLFCLPFLFSDDMRDLVGAGFPFLGAAVLVAGGVVAVTKSVAIR